MNNTCTNIQVSLKSRKYTKFKMQENTNFITETMS